MKTNFKKLLVIAITFLFILNIAVISNAENDLTTDILKTMEENGIPVSENEMQVLSAPNNESGKNYYSLSQSDVTIDTDVYGDVFVCANGNVNINSKIFGNVFVLSKQITISGTAEINAALFCVTQNLDISGVIKGNCYSVSQETNIRENGVINLDLFDVSENLNISGNIKRDAFISVSNITLNSGAYINGDLNYSSENEASISKNSVGGEINFSQKTENENTTVTTTKSAITSFVVVSFIKKCLTQAIFAVALFFILKYIGSNIITEHSNFKTKLGKYILFGLLLTFVSPILLIILLAIGLTSKVAFLLILAYIVFILISSSTFIIVLANMLAEKYKEKLNLSENLKMVLLISVLSILYKLLGLIPVLGGLAKFAIIILGVGITICSLPANKAISNSNME